MIQNDNILNLRKHKRSQQKVSSIPMPPHKAVVGASMGAVVSRYHSLMNSKLRSNCGDPDP